MRHIRIIAGVLDNGRLGMVGMKLMARQGKGWRLALGQGDRQTPDRENGPSQGR
jgi:hypothetical protein